MDFKFVPAPSGAIIDEAFEEENIDNFMQAVINGRDRLKQGGSLDINCQSGVKNYNVNLEGVYENGVCYTICLVPDAGAGAYDRFTSSSLIISEDGIELIVDGLDERYPDNRELLESENSRSVNSYDLLQAKNKLGPKIDLSALKEEEKTGVKSFFGSKRNEERQKAQVALERGQALTDKVLSSLQLDSKTESKSM